MNVNQSPTFSFRAIAELELQQKTKPPGVAAPDTLPPVAHEVPVLVTEKPCLHCGITKPLSEFNKQGKKRNKNTTNIKRPSRFKDGLRNICKPCQYADQSNRIKKKDPAEWAKVRADYQRTYRKRKIEMIP